MSEKSLQINLNSLDDARALIQNLQSVRKHYDAHRCQSILLLINEDALVEIEEKITGLINWTRTYRETVKPQAKDGNVLFPLPHYKEPSQRSVMGAQMAASRKPSKQPGKPTPLVQAALAGT